MNKKVLMTAKQISFLMPHQEVLPDLKEIAEALYPVDADPAKIDRNSKEYLAGASEALVAFIKFLTEKGFHIQE